MMSVALGVAIAIGAPGCATEAGAPPDTSITFEPEYMSSADEQLVRDTVDQNIRYWTERGVGGLASTQLVILSGDTEFLCNKEQGTSDTLLNSQTIVMQYCSGSDTIAVSALSVNAQNVIGLGQLGIVFWVAHECGHRVQDAKGELPPSLYSNSEVQAVVEVAATGYAGEWLRTVYDETAITEIAADLRSHGSASDRYGTSDQHADALLAGAGYSPTGS